MELFKILSEMKFKSYHYAIQFIISITVPGILILFYFYNSIFNDYDFYRLMLIVFAISSTLFICSYAICSAILVSLERKFESIELATDENETLEVLFLMSSQFSLVNLCLLLFIYFLVGSKNIHSFIGYYVIIEILYGVLANFVLRTTINEALKKIEIKKEKAIEAEKNKELRIQSLKEDLFDSNKKLKFAELELERVNEFQFFRTFQTKRLQILSITDKIKRIKSNIEQIQSNINILIEK
jgi:hypothetical protein